MKPSTSARSLSRAAACSLAFVGCTTTRPKDQASSTSSRTSIDAQVDASLSKLYDSVKGSRELVAKSSGVLVFPAVVGASLGVGAEYGRGALRVNGRTQSYYSTTAGSVGFQAGAQSKAVIYLFTTQAALDKFRNSKGWTAGRRRHGGTCHHRRQRQHRHQHDPPTGGGLRDDQRGAGSRRLAVGREDHRDPAVISAALPGALRQRLSGRVAPAARPPACAGLVLGREFGHALLQQWVHRVGLLLRFVRASDSADSSRGFFFDSRTRLAACLSSSLPALAADDLLFGGQGGHGRGGVDRDHTRLHRRHQFGRGLLLDLLDHPDLAAAQARGLGDGLAAVQRGLRRHRGRASADDRRPARRRRTADRSDDARLCRGAAGANARRRCPSFGAPARRAGSPRCCAGPGAGRSSRGARRRCVLKRVFCTVWNGRPCFWQMP
jgi:hypothetical protein